MSGDDREPIGRKGKKAQPKAAPNVHCAVGVMKMNTKKIMTKNK